jgi:hypothetical protein
MVRKRKPLVLNSMTVVLDAPGLHLVRRRNGVVHQYWEASAQARKRGYLPRTVHLHYDLETIAGRRELERRCKELTSEMLEWLGDPEDQKKPCMMAPLLRSFAATRRTRTLPIADYVKVRPASTRTVPDSRAGDWSPPGRSPQWTGYPRCQPLPAERRAYA